MKFQPDQLPGVNVISRQHSGCVWVNAQAFEHSVVVPSRGEPARWAADTIEALTAADFDALLELEPEVVIFGSGGGLRFVSPALYRSLIERRIGIETMDTAAACRTYNVLAAEGRSVVAALIVESHTPTRLPR